MKDIECLTVTHQNYFSAASIEDFYMRNEEGAHWCNACGYHSHNKTDVCRHIESRHLEFRHIVCKFCQRPLKTKRMLQIHIRKQHWHDKMNMKEMMQWHGIA